MQKPPAKKKFGQHFLINQSIIQRIIETHTEGFGTILEIGPGRGALTQKLKSLPTPVHVIEVDSRFIPGLEELLPIEHIHQGDALEFNFSHFLSQNCFQTPVHLVSNLPYNVGTPLLLKLVQAEQITRMTVMLQKEVGDRLLLSQFKKNNMNGLGLLCQTFFRVQKLTNVSKGSFSPPPKVESMVLVLDRVEDPPIELMQFKALDSFCRNLFKFPRKQLQTVLKNCYSPEKLKECFQQSGIDPQIRAEVLSKDQVYSLFTLLTN